MRWIGGFLIACLSLVGAAARSTAAGSAGDPGPAGTSAGRLALDTEFSLDGDRTPEAHYYTLRSSLVTYAEDGTRTTGDTYRLWLSCTPSGSGPGRMDQCVCRKATVQAGTGVEKRIPSLDGWSYPFIRTASGKDENGQVFGIDHARFQNLSDASGEPLPPDAAYAVYNCFIDFHAFCNALSEPVTNGKGIQDLKRIGQKIVHDSSFSETPVDLGSVIAEGSSFKNGEMTLEFKGLGGVAGTPCAVLGLDSGRSSFLMLMRPAPNVEVRTKGASHYRGDMLINLASRWVETVALDELVVASVTMDGQKLANTVVERALAIRSVPAGEFGED